MKKILGLAAALCISVASFAQTKSLAIEAILPEGDYHLTDVLSGEEVRLNQLAEGNNLLVMFTCNTCPFVIKNIDRTKEILDFAQGKNVKVALINSNEAQRQDVDSKERMAEFGKKQSYPNYLEDKGSTVANLFGASHTPEVFLFNKEGVLVYKGAMDDSPADPKAAKAIYLKDAIASLAAGKDIKVKESKSVGCSIKRVKK